MKKGFWKWFFFWFVVALTGFLYFKTTAPTVVFWDVGEFLAASHILGIPHPPGTPLYVIICKFLDMLPLPLAHLYQLINGTPAINSVLKMTLVPILTGAFGMGLIYLIIYEVIDLWGGKKEVPEHFQILSAVVGALLAATGAVNWLNSIEAETYTPANFFSILFVYLALLWYKNRQNRDALRFLLAGLYLIVLGTGIHLTGLFALPAVFAFVAFVEPKIIFTTPFWGLAGALGALLTAFKHPYEPSTASLAIGVISIALMLYYFWKEGAFKDWTDPVTLLFLASAAAMAWGLFGKNNAFVVIGSLASVVLVYVKGRLWRDWRGLGLLLIVLAFTPEFWLIVRAWYLHHHPNAARMNEADPYTWQAFMDVLTRKQYEPAKMFPRRVPWSIQMKVYWLYLVWQYPQIVLPLVFMALVGLTTHWQRDRKTLVLVGLTLFFALVGFFIAFNLKDSPTQPVGGINPRTGQPLLPTEVRDRDYFYAASHVFLSLYAGLGLWEVIRLALRYIKIRWLVAALAYPVPLLAIAFHVYKIWPQVDRSHFYLAEDSAYNLLISPKDSGVMFTNGDNDTFPLWFDQEVLGIRRDLIIANLSLLNTNWYIRQLKYWGAPISFSDEEIENLPPILPSKDPKRRYFFLRDFMIRDMIATSVGYKPKRKVVVRGLKEPMEVPEVYLEPAEVFLEKVFKGKEFKVPLYFAMTTTPDAWRGWEDYMVMEGMAFRLVGHRVGQGSYPLENVDEPRTRWLFADGKGMVEYLKEASFNYTYNLPEGVFRFRGVLDPKVPKWDRYDTNNKIIRNYAQVAFSLGNYYARRGQWREAADALNAGRLLIKQLPIDKYPEIESQLSYINLSLADVAIRAGLLDLAAEAIEEARQLTPGAAGVKLKAAELAFAKGDTARAEGLYAEVLKAAPKNPDALVSAGKFYLEIGQAQKAESLYSEAINVLSTQLPDSETFHGWARALKATGKADSVLKAVRERGLKWEAAGSWVSAAQELLKAYYLGDTSKEVVLGLLSAMLKAGDDMLVEWALGIAKAYEADPRYKLYEAEFYARKDRVEDAVKLLSEAVGGLKRPRDLQRAAELMMHLGKFKEAASLFEKAVKAGLDEPRVIRGWASALERIGERAKADSLRKSLKKEEK